MLSVIFLLLTSFTSCKKKDTDIGLDVQGGTALGLNTIDTFEIITYSELIDSVSSQSKSSNLLGSYVDPKFGKADYGFVSQLLLSANNPNFGDQSEITIDSVVLSLRYSTLNTVSKYGELDPQTFEVYEVLDDISLDSTYYTFSTVQTSTDNLVIPGTEIITPDPFNNVVVGNDTIDPQLRIKLNTSLGWKLITAQGGGHLVDDDAFKAFFKGIQVKVNNSQSVNEGAVLYFDLEDTESKLTIYYKDDIVSPKPALKEFDFVISSESARFTQANFDYSGTYLEQVLMDTVSGQNEFYYQANHIWGALEFPDLMNIKDNQGLIVNKAELIVPAQFYPTDELFVPADMFVFYKNDDFDDFLVPDFSNPDGLYRESTGSYHFLITRYVQRVLSGELPNNGIRISNSFFFSTATRAVFNGPLSTNKMKPKLIITYSNY